MKRGSDTPRQAITDLVDERSHRFLLRYPVGLFTVLLVFGIVAFTIIGYFGYPDDPPLLGTVLHDPWPLFAWFCVLALVFQLSILRHPILRRELLTLVPATVLSILLVSGAWYSGLVGRLVGPAALVSTLLSSPLIPVLVIAVLALGMAVLLVLSAPTLRYVFAGLLTLLGVISLLAGAEFSGLYMHTANRTLGGDPRLAFGHALAIFLAALASVLGGFIVMAAACAALVISMRVVTNSVQFLVLLLVFAYAYLPAFAVINSITWLSGISFRTPFFQPSVGGWIAVILFVVTGVRPVLSAFLQLVDINPPSATSRDGSDPRLGK